MGFQKGHKDFMPKESRKRAAAKISRALKGKIVSQETKKKQSEAKKGKPTWWMKAGLPNPMKGRKQNQTHREAMAKLRGENNYAWKGGTKKCADCGKILNHYVEVLSCRECYGKRNRGENHFNWRGGITPFYKQIRECSKYKKWLKDCLIRDNYICQGCKIHGGDLVVDHIKQFALVIHLNNVKSLEDAENCLELWDIDNGRTLCVDCHKQTETYSRHIKYYEVPTVY